MKWLNLFFFVFLFLFIFSSFLEAQDLPKIIISEIYFNPDSLHGATGTLEWQNEWIELKNLEEREIDISGWKIIDNKKEIIIPPSLPIPSGGFAILTPSSTTFEFWEDIPEKTIKIVLNSKIGNGLSNKKDKISLIDKEGNLIDSLSWERNSRDETICKISSKEGVSLEKKPFFFERNTLFCSYFNQENPNPGREVLDFYWRKEIEDLKDSLSGYEILSAKVVIGKEEILDFLPPQFPGPMCKTLIAKLELEEILEKEKYSQFGEREGYGGVAMKIEREDKIYLFAFDLFFNLSYLFVSKDGGKNWQRENSDYFIIYQFGNSIIFTLNMEKLPPLPWKLSFFSGFLFENLKDYQILDQTDEILISERENKLPLPKIKISPQNPVKGIEVFFDGSFSFDPDGKITKFEWQITSATFFGTSTTFIFNENGDYQITLAVTDDKGASFSTTTILKVKPFSFAIITDLHIGRGYPDYNGETFDDGYNGQDYYLTERLRKVVNWINENKDNIDCDGRKCEIKFLVVLGDISDSAERSEFKKAKEILDKLNDPNQDGNTNDGIPYIPLFGNHDVWPYTKEKEAETSLGEIYFEEIFWNENATNTKLMKERLNFERDKENPKYKNFSFSFGGINFLGLDFNSREKTIGGVKPEGVLHDATINWFKNKLNKYQGKESIIIFSHEPFAKPKSRSFHSEEPKILPLPQGNFEKEEINRIKEILLNYENIIEGKQILATFGGHIHGFEKILKEYISISPIDLFMYGNWEYPSLSTIPVITTEALMVAGNEKDISKMGIVRIVKVFDKENIDYSTLQLKIPALNPYISWAYKFLEGLGNPCVFFKSHPFTQRDISSYQWEFGDGATGKGKVVPFHCYSKPGIYNVTSTVFDSETGVSEWITRKIEIKAGLISKIIKIKDELIEKAEIISQKIKENLLEFGKYLIKGKDRLLLKVKHSSAEPVGEIIIDFDKAEGDIDLSEMIFDTDINKRKSILYMPNWPEVVEKEKILFIPK